MVLYSGLKAALVSFTVDKDLSGSELNFRDLQHAIGLNRDIACFSKTEKGKFIVSVTGL